MRIDFQDEYIQLKEDYNKLLNSFTELVDKERKRIDYLIEDIQNKFEKYMKDLKEKGVIIKTETSRMPLLMVSEYVDSDSLQIPTIVDLKIDEFHLKFIKGFKNEVEK